MGLSETKLLMCPACHTALELPTICCICMARPVRANAQPVITCSQGCIFRATVDDKKSASTGRSFLEIWRDRHEVHEAGQLETAPKELLQFRAELEAD